MTGRDLPLPETLPERCDLDLARILYSLCDSDHPFCEKWRPEVIGRGGEHVVYRSGSEPETVLKVHIELLERAVSFPGPETTEAIVAHVRDTNRRYTEMRRHFRSAVVPELRMESMEVPVTDGMLLWQFKGEAPESSPCSVAAAVGVQEYLAALEGKWRSITSGYSEKRIRDIETLRRANTFLLDPGSSRADAIDAFRLGQMETDVKELLDIASGDAGLTEILRGFVRETAAYCGATGETLDLAGSGNVLIAGETSGWRCYFADALYPGREKMLHRTRSVVQAAARGETIDGGDANILMNGLNFVRTVNGLAGVLGLPERVRVADEKIDFGSDALIQPILDTQLGKVSPA